MNTSTVIVIGGGVIGLSTAYQLALKRAGQIILIDKGALADGASCRAAGIGTQLQWCETAVLARRIGFELFRQFSNEWDDYTFHDEHGCLNLFTPEAWHVRKALLPLYDRLDVPYELLDASEVRYRWPALNPPDAYVALHDPRGGYNEPAEYLPALAKRVRQLGVEVLENEQVVGFLRAKERLAGVRTPQRVIEADAVVSTANVWSHSVWRELELRFPTKHFVHQRYVTMPLSRPFVAPPVNADPYLGYIRSAAGNRVLMGIETSERAEFRVESNEFNMNELATPIAVRDEGRKRFVAFAPSLNNVLWESEHVGLISFTVDGEPILGPVKSIPGLFVATSFNSGGFNYNSVIGLLMAEMVLDGRAQIDVSAFSPDRFDSAAIERYLGDTIPQCQAVRRRH
ncbi:MAG: FAD-binding oxidoreductase [Pirellulales bacterium]|nr:FAD-binding oxidoreductase [Pirellulales bacterium]